ncbi:MAG: CHAP domain-containing protein, partial [Candidatus Saccharimonadales bacterium]
HSGERIIIPDANVQAAASTAAAAAAGSGSASFPWGSKPVYGFNGYDFGNCTWYVASQVNVPSNWGNADTWAYYARLSGWNVNSRPAAGAIAQTSGGYFGHVAIVRSVNKNGTLTISEMNFAGFDVIDTRTVSSSEFQNYITR